MSAFIGRSRHKVLIVLLGLVSQGTKSIAQTGIQPFGSYDVNFDYVNTANLGVHLDIPLFDHKGRGANNGSFIHLQYDGSANGDGWGLSAGTARGGGINVQQLNTENCSGQNANNGTNTLFSYTFTDSTGYVHQFPGTSRQSACTATPNPEPSTPLNVFSGDGSGYLLNALGSQATVYSPSGDKIEVGFSSPSVTDSNGNKGTVGGVTFPPTYGYSGILTDDSNTTVTVSGGSYDHPRSGPSTSRSPTVVQYTDINGNTQSVTIAYRFYNLPVVFTDPTHQVTGVGLVDSITFPDGSAYHFAYQPSPFDPSVSTGFISSITLPTGGTISYQYTYSSVCLDPLGSHETGLTRSTPDGTTTYTISGVVVPTGPCATPSSTTFITRPDGTTQEEVHFVADTYDNLSHFLVVETAHYWKSSSEGTLKSTMRCYNGASGDCTASTVLGTINQLSTTTTLGNQSSKTVEYLSSAALPTEIDEYDYGATSPTRKTVTAYASLGNNISDRPSSVTITDGAGGFGSKTTYEYDTTSLVTPPNAPTNGLPGLQPVTGSRGNPTSIHRWIDSSNFLTTTNVYDIAGQLSSTTTPKGYTTSYVYDSPTDTHLVTRSLPSTGSVNHTTQFVIDPATGLQTEQIDENGVHTRYFYNDPLERLTSITTAVGTPQEATTTYGFPSTTQRTIQQDQGTKGDGLLQTSLTLDSLGRTFRQTRPDSTTIETTYDAMGRIKTVSNPHFSTASVTDGTSSYQYDALGRVRYVCNPDNNSTDPSGCTPANSYKEWSYLGNVTTYFDELRNATSTTSDALGRIIGVVEPGSLNTAYGYDPLDNLETVNQAGTSADQPRVRMFMHDGLSRLKQAYNPESGWTCYGTTGGVAPNGSNCTPAYDGDSNLSAKTDARGVTINYSYDALERLYQKTYSDTTTPTVNFQYDTLPGQSTTNSIGRMTSESVSLSQNNSGLYQRQYLAYDPMGRVATSVECPFFRCLSGNPVTYVYDLAGHETAATVNYLDFGGALTINYHFDAVGRPDQQYLRSPEISQGQYLNVTSFSPLGGISRQQLFGEGARTYDNRGRTTGLQFSDLNGATSYGANYTYYPNGNVNTFVDSSNGQPVNGTVSYDYDSLNRLKTAHSSLSGDTSYSYDSFGNRALPLIYGATFAPNNNRIDCSTCYDPAGNLTMDIPGTPLPHTYSYDGEGRLSGITDLGMQYFYDAEGKRIYEASGGTLTKAYIYEPNNQFYTITNGSLNATRVEFFGGSEHLMTYDGTAGFSFPYKDALGTERARVDLSGTVQETCSNLPFGENQNCTGSDLSALHFTGKERDTESNFDYFGARYYSSNIGRFISPDPSGLLYADPANPQSLNLYSYALNNPLRLVDPTGLTSCFYGGVGDTPQNDADASDYESTGNQQECTDNGGTSLDVNASVTVNADNSSSDLITLDGGGSSTLIDRSTTAPSSVSAIPTPSVNACKAAAVAAGAAGGALAGGAAGGVVGGVAGGAGGTLVAPGVGTVGGGIVGAEGGATAGAWLGGVIGGGIGYVVGNVMCSSSTGGGGGSNTPQDRCTQVKQGAIESCSEQYVGRGYGSDAPALLRACVRQILTSAGCPNF